LIRILKMQNLIEPSQFSDICLLRFDDILFNMEINKLMLNCMHQITVGKMCTYLQ